MHAASHRDRGLVLIAVFKMVKALLLILAGVGVLSLLQPSVAAAVREWLAELTISQGQEIIQRAIALFDVVRPIQIEAAGLASICYGLLFATEGVGLWMGKRWAEFLTIFATGALIPFEVYELIRQVTAPRVLALLVNVAVVAYLIYRVRHPMGVRRELR
jgi:uncharacterized membrane protein (DUF2068 family)